MVEAVERPHSHKKRKNDKKKLNLMTSSAYSARFIALLLCRCKATTTRFQMAWLRNFTIVLTIYWTTVWRVFFFYVVYGFVVANLVREIFVETQTAPTTITSLEKTCNTANTATIVFDEKCYLFDKVFVNISSVRGLGKPFYNMIS